MNLLVLKMASQKDPGHLTSKSTPLEAAKRGLLGVTAVICCFYLFTTLTPPRQPSLHSFKIHRNNSTGADQAFEVIVSPRFSNGSFIVKKNMTKYWNQPLRKWNRREEILTSIRVPKTGSTSFDWILRTSVLPGDSVFSNGSTGLNTSCKMECIKAFPQIKHQPLWKDCYEMKNNLCCFTTNPIICGKHFDWSIVREGRTRGFQMAPIIVFRNPVERAVSHFY